jgi:hypothetical protein
MPLQNRVTPFGEIVAYPERGTFMGNRGILHDEHRQLTSRHWASNVWITCRLEFKGWKRQVMSPRSYTELFFLDEVTALSAGHRPCAECRREDYNRFRHYWQIGNPHIVVKTVKDMDRQLHRERIGAGRQKRTYQAMLDALPDGTFIALDGHAYLVWYEDLLLWSPGGYQRRLPRMAGAHVTVLTPASIVNALIAGYIPQRSE